MRFDDDSDEEPQPIFPPWPDNSWRALNNPSTPEPPSPVASAGLVHSPPSPASAGSVDSPASVASHVSSVPSPVCVSDGSDCPEATPLDRTFAATLTVTGAYYQGFPRKLLPTFSKALPGRAVRPPAPVTCSFPGCAKPVSATDVCGHCKAAWFCSREHSLDHAWGLDPRCSVLHLAASMYQWHGNSGHLRYRLQPPSIIRGCWNCYVLPEAGVEVKLRYCNSCITARYCSRVCQKKDWAEEHKTQCKKLKDLRKRQKVPEYIEELD